LWYLLQLTSQGYDSVVGERGRGLSGGERQRISIARAADRPADPDPGRGHLVGRLRNREGNPEGARQPGEGLTTIAIAHRLSTLHRADRLVVLDRREVVEEGTHLELMAREGAYHRLYEAQARNVDQDPDDSNKGA
jgi:ATP-binding cassette subfamily B protein